MRFRIFGNGAFGKALGKIFHNMILEDSLKDEFQEIVAGDIVIPAVPSDVCIEVINKILKFGKPDAIMLVSKGLASNKLLTQEIYENGNLKHIPLLYFAGPNLAKEINDESTGNNLQFISATIAGPYEFTSKIKQLFHNIQIDITEDVILPQIAAIMKNITAFVIGYLNPTQNARATLIMDGMQQAVKLAKFLGSKEDNYLRACFSDFILTCTSADSRNFQAGRNFKNASVDHNITQESLKSVDNIYALKQHLKLPIVEFFYHLVKHNKCEIGLLFDN